MKRFKILALATAWWLAMSLPVMAAQYAVIEENKSFNKKDITIKVGDSIIFINNDKYNHNIYSKTESHEFDSGARKHGTVKSITFSRPGKIKARCAIHPRMKLTIIVER